VFGLQAMKGVKRDNPQDRKFKQLRQQRQRLPTTSTAHTPLADKLGTAEAKIRKEIAIMKKCRHPHVVRLLEVIDDRMQTKVYMGAFNSFFPSLIEIRDMRACLLVAFLRFKIFN
jgi:serine/threonine protein kinase